MRKLLKCVLRCMRNLAAKISCLCQAIGLGTVGIWIRRGIARPLDRLLDRFPKLTRATCEGPGVDGQVIEITRPDCPSYSVELVFRADEEGASVDVLLRKDAWEDPVASHEYVEMGQMPPALLTLTPDEVQQVLLLLREADHYCEYPYRIME